MRPIFQLRKLSLSKAEPYGSHIWLAGQGFNEYIKHMLPYLCSVLSTSGGTGRMVGVWGTGERKETRGSPLGGKCGNLSGR